MIETKRLLLRQWQESDFAEFAVINSDPEVMRYFPAVMTESESNSWAKQCQARIADRGWGWFAVEVLDGGAFIGMVGLNSPPFEIPLGYQIEIGWRLAKAHWNQGYATEAARACLVYAFNNLSTNSVCAFTPTDNQPSRRVMEKLGMVDLDSPFMHPMLASDSPLAEHVLYAISRDEHAKSRE